MATVFGLALAFLWFASHTRQDTVSRDYRHRDVFSRGNAGTFPDNAVVE